MAIVGTAFEVFRAVRSAGLALVVGMLAELSRAVAAEQRYQDLKRTDATAFTRRGRLPGDLPRLVFDEFYSFKVECVPDVRRKKRHGPLS
jgi:hypothetical protein